VAGVTIRCSRHTRDSNRVKAANTARSAQDSRGLFTWRRNTVTACLSTRISTFLDCALRASSPSQAITCRKIRYSSRTATIDDQPNHHCLAMPQVTAMDGQFGTHKCYSDRAAQRDNQPTTSIPLQVRRGSYHS
jgi:hypothetical protein